MADSRAYLRRKVYDMLITDFPVEYGSTLAIKFENQKFEQPVDTPFLATYLMFTSSGRASVGTVKKFDRHCGFFCIECNVPEETGTEAMWRIAGAVERVLQEQQTTLDDGSYLSLYTSKVVGNTSQDGWYFVTVMIPFELDACHD